MRAAPWRVRAGRLLAALAACSIACPALTMQSPVAVAVAEGGSIETSGTAPNTVAAAPAAMPLVVPSKEPIDEASVRLLLQARHLAVPVAGVARASLRETYVDRRGDKSHEAIDIPAPRGTPVVAVDDGRIVKLFHSVRGGLTIYQFDSEQQFAYYYAHLDRYGDGVREGMAVRRGDLIGHVGSTGNAAPDAPHLHFAIFKLGPERQWWKGTAINPFPFLSGAPR